MKLKNTEFYLEMNIWKEDLEKYIWNETINFKWKPDHLNRTRLTLIDGDIENPRFYDGKVSYDQEKHFNVEINKGDTLIQETPKGCIEGEVEDITLLKEIYELNNEEENDLFKLKIRLEEASFEGRFNALDRGASGLFCYNIPSWGVVETSISETSMSMRDYILVRKLASKIDPNGSNWFQALKKAWNIIESLEKAGV